MAGGGGSERRPRPTVRTRWPRPVAWHAERAAGRPKAAKLATNPALRSYVQDRLAGAILATGGAAVAGPAVAWTGRRQGRRRSRRWGWAWSPQQIAERLRVDYPDDM